MGLSSKLFYDSDPAKETLFSRISLTDEQLSDSMRKKDELLDLLKPELSKSLGVEIKHWLQGSYKNHTLIRPVHKGGEFDIDVGLYLMCNAEEEGFSAIDVKRLSREVLLWYIENWPEAKVADSKNSCERLVYPASFHLDIPIYYFDSVGGYCRLATQSNGWVNSDPKAFQDWFDETVSKLEKTSLARLRRILKYLKTWMNLKSVDDKVCVPSIALTALVAYHFVDAADDDSFIETAIKVMEYILDNDSLNNPVGSSDFFCLDVQELALLRNKANALKKTCLFIKNSADSFLRYIFWTAIFEHMFPPFMERNDEVVKETNLPAITKQPKIRVRHLDKKKKVLSHKVTAEIQVYRDDSLYFLVDNREDYSEYAKIHWIVRNQDNEAQRVNDLGHKTILNRDEERYEACRYRGTHYMECFVLDDGSIKGISAVKVNVMGFSRPLRNPPKRKYYRG